MVSSLRIHPDRDTFDRLTCDWALVPVWAELTADVSTPVGAFAALAGSGPGVLLESVERSEQWGRYSFVAGDPAAVVVVEPRGLRIENEARDLPIRPLRRGTDALTSLKSLAEDLTAPRVRDLPALTGGLIGYLAYEAASLFDGSPHPGPGREPVPPMGFLLIDRAVVFDHWRQRLVLVAHMPAAAGYSEGVRAIEELADRMRSLPAIQPAPIAAPGEQAPRVANVPDEAFSDSVARAKEHILAGDIFQAVLSRRLSLPAPAGAFPIYRRLRLTNPSPYMYLVRLGGLELAGSSPEPLVRVVGKHVLTRPIAGTRPRGRTADEDRALEEDLTGDPKERAEHAMLVDLARNDLGRVCRSGTVRVTELMAVERWSQVMHLVSTVEGELRDGVTPLDAVAATFPAGTVTGAPKRRAMEIIAEEEPTARGAYAGAVGYLSFAGDLDVCITIRTAVVEAGVAHIQAGAGIVADSDPESELRETEAKAAAVIRAVVGGAS